MSSAFDAQVGTVRIALLDALRSATSHNRSDGVAPAAVLWTDKERHWESVIPSLRPGIPLLTLGPYDSGSLSGPAIWARCAIAGTLPDVGLQEGTPVIYLPGVARADLRAVEDCPRELQPLAELQYRGVIFSHPNGRDWTPSALLGKRLGIEIASGHKAQSALARALPKLLERPVAELRTLSPIGAGDLDELLIPDPEREILVWLDDPGAYAEARNQETKSAFAEICNARFGFDPASDGELEAAHQLVEGSGPWRPVWKRYAEAPKHYPNIPALLDHAGPSASDRLFDEISPYRPRDNRAEEDSLRDSLLALADATPPAAREHISKLEARHGVRREWVWAELGQAPLARSLLHLAALTEETGKPPGSGATQEICEWYVAEGWEVDAQAMNALAAGQSHKDAGAVRVAVRSVYEDWLEECARRFQQAIESGGIAEAQSLDPSGPEPGVCTLFTDGLRYDLARWLARLLSTGDTRAGIAWRFTGIPGVTPTAKPLLSPLGPELLPGNGFEATVNGSRVTASSLRKMLGERGYQVLAAEEVGETSGTAWTERGDLDARGHASGSDMAREAEDSLSNIAERIQMLLDAGWREVRVVTDHGWLLLPGGLPKTTLPEHLTDVRKGRCARLKPGANTGQQTVPWSLDPQVSVAVAPGISAFEAGKEYEHGGLSPQECVVPVLTVTASDDSSVAATITEVRWTGLRCRVRVGGAPEAAMVELRSRAADPSTSIAGPKALKDDTASLFVADDSREFEAAFVVVLDKDGRVLRRAQTVVGS